MVVQMSTQVNGSPNVPQFRITCTATGLHAQPTPRLHLVPTLDYALDYTIDYTLYQPTLALLELPPQP